MTPRLGQRLRELREERRLSVRDLSERSGVTAGVIARLERGQMEPKPAAIGQLAHALGVAPEELAGPAPAPDEGPSAEASRPGSRRGWPSAR
jgi:transcriptional regulator with XRE-family HTH domain